VNRTTGSLRRLPSATSLPMDELTVASWAASALAAAVEINLCGFLSLLDDVTIEEIAIAFDLSPALTELLVSLCTVFGMTARHEQRVMVTPASEHLMAGSSGGDWTPALLAVLSAKARPAWDWMRTGVRSADPVHPRPVAPDWAGVDVLSRAAASSALGDWCAGADRGRILDADAVGLTIGSAIAGDYDTIQLNLVLSDWTTGEISTVLTECARALPPGGMVILTESLTDMSRSVTASPALLALTSALPRFWPRPHRCADYRALLRSCGFAHTHVLPVTIPVANSTLLAFKE
jgi:hypothetical protein